MKDSRDHSGHNPEKHERGNERGNETHHQRQHAPVEDLSALDRRALTEMLVDKIIIELHPSKDGKRHYIRTIPYQDPQQEDERLKAVHEARVKIVPRV